MRKQESKDWSQLTYISYGFKEFFLQVPTFFSSASSLHLSITSFSTTDHFDVSATRAKSCPGVLFKSFLLYIRDLSDPPTLSELARMAAAS